MNKVTRKKTSKYTTISNGFLRDNNLSLKAKGFLTVIMALPDDWDFSIKGICSVLKEGKTSVYSAVQELKENRYCKTTPSRDEKGLIIGLDYVFYEEPYEEEPNKEEPQQDYPHPENQDMDNMPQLNTKDDKGSNRTKDLPKEERIDKSIPKKKAKFDVYADLSYVDAEYADIWKEWLEYKDAIKSQYNAQKGAIIQYNSLLKYADNNVVLANAIVKRSIERSWQGLFELNDKEKALYLSERSPYYTKSNTLPKGWEQERYDMYIRNGYTITDDGRLFKDGKEIK